MLNVYESFKLLYYALDYLDDIYDCVELKEFCDDMCPFIWKDDGSADFCIYQEYNKLYKEKFDDNECTFIEAYNFAIDYLDKEYSIYENDYAKKVKEIFLNISIEDWCSKGKKMLEEDK